MNIIERIKIWLLKYKLEKHFFSSQSRALSTTLHSLRGHKWVYHRAESLVNGEAVGKVVIRCCMDCDAKEELKDGEWVSRFADECISSLAKN